MNSTPSANRLHIGLFGKTNSGKSSILNKITGQEIAIVSDIEGTTTDPVNKAMELIQVGPVIFIDTPGIQDDTKLGKLREKKTLSSLNKVDIALYIINSADYNMEGENKFLDILRERKIPYIKVFNKIDLLDEKNIETLKKENKEAIFISTFNQEEIENLTSKLIEELKIIEKEETLLGDILPYGSTVIMVVPIDSEAPKGRLILPQVQLIRDALDHGIKSYVVRDTELKRALDDLKKVDLVVTDSQAFREVSKIVPSEIKLTSFSILMARQKGDLKKFLQGVYAIKSLNKNSKVLIMESCSHNTSHEDIGKVKIPRLLNKHLGFNLNYEFSMGEAFEEENIKAYDLIIHCGSCMLTKNIMKRRLEICNKNSVPITNYGIILAYLTGILERSVEVFRKEI